jgi:mono/diheme cytochrome c family protein
VNEYEVSRRQLRLDPARGGFVRFEAAADAYLPLAGNDYGFATPQRDRHGETSAIVTKLRSRCSACHGPDGTGFGTFALIPMPERGLPPVVHLRQPNDTRALYVAASKEARDDFTRLVAAAGLRR